MNPAISNGSEDVEKCHICGDNIWESRWSENANETMKKHVCSFCFSKIKNGGEYRPKVYAKSDLAVCERCGETSATVKLTREGWFCEDCSQ